MIRSCPFCGSECHVVRSDTGVAYLYKVSCIKGHSLDSYFISEDEAISAWNKRPQVDRIRATVVHLRSALKHNLHSESQYQIALTQIIEICDQ